MAGTGKEQSPEIVSPHHKVRVMDSQCDVNYTLSDVMREMKEFRADMYQKMDIIRQGIIANIDSKIKLQSYKLNLMQNSIVLKEYYKVSKHVWSLLRVT